MGGGNRNRLFSLAAYWCCCQTQPALPRLLWEVCALPGHNRWSLGIKGTFSCFAAVPRLCMLTPIATLWWLGRGKHSGIECEWEIPYQYLQSLACAARLCLLCPRKTSLWQGSRPRDEPLPGWLSSVTRLSVPTRWLQRLWHCSEHTEPCAKGLQVP